MSAFLLSNFTPKLSVLTIFKRSNRHIHTFTFIIDPAYPYVIITRINSVILNRLPFLECSTSFCFSVWFKTSINISSSNKRCCLVSVIYSITSLCNIYLCNIYSMTHKVLFIIETILLEFDMKVTSHKYVVKVRTSLSTDDLTLFNFLSYL